MVEERYHATTQNRFYPDMSNVNKNITVKAKIISPATLQNLRTQFSLESISHNILLETENDQFFSIFT